MSKCQDEWILNLIKNYINNYNNSFNENYLEVKYPKWIYSDIESGFIRVFKVIEDIELYHFYGRATFISKVLWDSYWGWDTKYIPYLCDIAADTNLVYKFFRGNMDYLQNTWEVNREKYKIDRKSDDIVLDSFRYLPLFEGGFKTYDIFDYIVANYGLKEVVETLHEAKKGCFVLGEDGKGKWLITEVIYDSNLELNNRRAKIK